MTRVRASWLTSVALSQARSCLHRSLFPSKRKHLWSRSKPDHREEESFLASCHALERGDVHRTDQTRVWSLIPCFLSPTATRESAFVHAIASAGVAFAVTRSCAEGSATICGCDTRHKGSPGEGWKWGGCSEDVEFGSMVSREFADARENRPDARSAMNRHNNEAGRTSIIELMHLKCKCHGLSGSCEVKTCWWSQPDFRVIGDYLKDKYDSASEMVVEKHRESRGWVETLRPKYNFFKAPTEKDLVYYENSPNFCEPNPETGSFGTRDRICNVTSHGIDGCDLLCCGRGHNTRTEKRKEKCHCIFHWCCYVRCQECIRVYDVHTCK
ncbi:protein Wnt-3a isoform X1 [Pseudopipra pipra]|uniref:protein Wnt-3a isoform X1 n=2 Tax=Passeriformes TaxID=9126 RepID=UPI003139C28C